MAMEPSLHIRDFRGEDAAALARLFFDTVRTVNLGDYSREQVEAWAPAVPDAAAWRKRMAGRHTLVAEDETGLVGFVELEEHGHVDMLYCRADRVRQGVGSALYAAVEARARRLGLKRLFTSASLTARPFFERQGFRVLYSRTVERLGVELTQFGMEKDLAVLPSTPD
jgi:putative acetyltransferase